MDVDLPQRVGSELLSVRVGQQAFALDILLVKEIRGWSAATPLPHAPQHLLGMMDLRGTVMPVLDLGARLGLGSAMPTPTSVVVVVQVGDNTVGLLVEAVCDILQVSEGLIQPAPRAGTGMASSFVSGVMTSDEGIISVLCLYYILSVEGAIAA